MKTSLIIFSLWLIPYLLFGDVVCCFSPEQDCEQVWVDAINTATNHIYVSCFGIENQNIARALIDRLARGVDVKVCVDKLQAAGKGSLVSQLKDAGIEVVVKRTGILEHNKMMSVDGRTGIIGSWNLSDRAAAQDNSLVLFSNETNLVAKIEATWKIIYERDKP